MPTTEERTAKLEGLTGQTDKRLTTFENEVIRLHEKLDDRFDKVSERFEQVNNRIDQKFNWLTGIIITMWVSLIITMLFK